jgi:hypothetical protein
MSVCIIGSAVVQHLSLLAISAVLRFEPPIKRTIRMNLWILGNCLPKLQGSPNNRTPNPRSGTHKSEQKPVLSIESLDWDWVSTLMNPNFGTCLLTTATASSSTNFKYLYLLFRSSSRGVCVEFPKVRLRIPNLGQCQDQVRCSSPALIKNI